MLESIECRKLKLDVCLLESLSKFDALQLIDIANNAYFAVRCLKFNIDLKIDYNFVDFVFAFAAVYSYKVDDVALQ